MYSKKVAIIGVAVSTIALGTGVVVYAEMKPATVELAPIQLAYGEVGNAKTIKKHVHHSNIKEIAIVKGQINSHQIGLYPVTLKITTNQGKEIEKQLVVRVVDQEAPKIISQNDVIEAGDVIHLQDYVRVVDNVDGDVTGRIDLPKIDSMKVGKQMVTVTAIDTSGNKSIEKIPFTIQDTTKPTLEMDDVELMVGEGFDPLKNVTAKDRVDGDLSERIKIRGIVGKSAGTYSLTYQVADKAGNEAEEIRQIVVKEAPIKEKTSSIQVSGNNIDTIKNVVEPASVAPTITAPDSTMERNESEDTNKPVTETVVAPPTEIVPTYTPMSIYMGETVIAYQNGGQGSGQGIIDTNPTIASTWGGAAIQSGSDGLNTHIIGHNPGVFSALFNLGIGSQVIITDGNGIPTTYTVRRIYEVDDYAVGIRDGVAYWNQMIGTGGGERVTFQTCEDDQINWVYEAVH